MANINPILQAASAASQAQDVGAANIQAATSAQSDASMAIMDIVRQKGAADSLVSNVEQLGKITTEQASLKVGDIYGTNLDKSTEVMSGLAAEASKAFTEKLQARKDIATKQQTNFFDDPLGFIVNRFTINDDIAKYNEASSRQEAFEKRQSDLNLLSQQGVQTQKAFQQTTNAAAMAAKAASIQAGAEVLAQQAIQQAQGFNIQGYQAAMAMPKEKLNIVTNVFHAQNAQEQQKIALAHLALAQEQFKWKKEEKENAEEFDSRLVETINKGSVILDGPNAVQIAPGSKEAKFVATMLKSNSEAGKDFQRKYFAGQSGIVAPTVSGTITAAQSGAGIFFTPSQAKVKELLGQVAHATVTNPNLDKKDPNAIKDFQTGMMRQLLDKELSNISVGSGTLFDPPSMNKIIKESSALQALPAVQKVLGPLIASGTELTPERTLPVLAKAIADKTLTMEQATDAAEIFQRQVAVNVADKNLIKFGLIPGKETVTSFKTSITTSPDSLFGGKEVINVANPMEFKKALMKYNMNKAVTERFTGAGATSGIGTQMEDINTMFTPTQSKAK